LIYAVPRSEIYKQLRAFASSAGVVATASFGPIVSAAAVEANPSSIPFVF
jgi:hypothetical protein